MSNNPQALKNILEAALLAAGEPLTLERLQSLFAESEAPTKEELSTALAALADDYAGRALELREVGSGYRLQVKSDLGQWVSRLWVEKPVRYSRALLETLALIAYRQPITRAEIEDIRGVAVSTHIIRTLEEREWIRVVGHREVPGRPALFGTTKTFLDYFSLRGLEDLPPLAEVRNLEDIANGLIEGEVVDVEPAQETLAAPVVLAPVADADDQEKPSTTDEEHAPAPAALRALRPRLSATDEPLEADAEAEASASVLTEPPMTRLASG